MKKIKIIFKSGAQIDVDYSSRIYNEIVENLGSDIKVESKSFCVNMSNVDGIFFIVVPDNSDI